MKLEIEGTNIELFNNRYISGDDFGVRHSSCHGTTEYLKYAGQYNDRHVNKPKFVH